jgi:hypothetical protein
MFRISDAWTIAVSVISRWGFFLLCCTCCPHLHVRFYRAEAGRVAYRRTSSVRNRDGFSVTLCSLPHFSVSFFFVGRRTEMRDLGPHLFGLPPSSNLPSKTLPNAWCTSLLLQLCEAAPCSDSPTRVVLWCNPIHRSTSFMQFFQSHGLNCSF